MLSHAFYNTIDYKHTIAWYAQDHNAPQLIDAGPCLSATKQSKFSKTRDLLLTGIEITAWLKVSA